MRRVFIAAVLALTLHRSAEAQGSTATPGDPAGLTDWRHLARPRQGESVIVDRLSMDHALAPAPNGGFLVLELTGPGVIDHLLTTSGGALLTLDVDGAFFWSGRPDEAVAAAAAEKESAGARFPAPLIFSGGPFRHILAPVGFQRSLRILVDRDRFPHHISYRTFPPGTEVRAAEARPDGPYAAGLAAAATQWKEGAVALSRGVTPPPERIRGDFSLPARGRQTVLQIHESGEVVHLEFHLNPPLTGSLRHVLIEIFHDGADAPSVRLPITDFVGMPHPWAVGRWDRYEGTLAAGLRYPWYLHTPRFHFPEVTFLFHLPIPFGNGLRIDLVNRSADVSFTGFVEGLKQPLSTAEAGRAARLCAKRSLVPVAASPELQHMISIPGPGTLVGLGLFLCGGKAFPAAARLSRWAMNIDTRPPIDGPGLLPLWFMGAYGGPITGRPVWNHPRMEDQFCGAMRHFITDPIPFTQSATFVYTPGAESNGAPTAATALAFWYRTGGAPYAADDVPEQAEPLPYSVYGPSQHGPTPDSRLVWFAEAEHLAPFGATRGGAVRIVEDTDHNYHPSGGRYLLVSADQPGDYADFVISLPPDRYVAVGTISLWGPQRAMFEFDLLSRQDARKPPVLPQGDDYYRGRAVGSVPMQAPVQVGLSLHPHRDSSAEFSPPMLNPARDQNGVLRFICQTKTMDGHVYLMKLDQVQLAAPSPPAGGWREFEDGVPPETSRGASAYLPKFGRLSWSGWGAWNLTSPPGGQARFYLGVPTAMEGPADLVLRGSLGAGHGTWVANVVSGGEATPLGHGDAEDAVMEWRIPLGDTRIPADLAVELTCMDGPKQEPLPRQPPPARLSLDAWTVTQRESERK